jgi:hypothetical protein
MANYTDTIRASPGCDNAAAVVPNDAGKLTATRRLYIGVAGDVTVDMVGGQVGVLFKAALAGHYLDVRVTRVYATGTTATNIVAMW